MDSVICVKNLVKKYGNHIAVDHLNFEVKKGEIFGLLGHNGAGKTTTMECILGLKKIQEGEVTILNKDAAKHRKELFEHVGVQLQNNSYQEKIKVGELCEETKVLYRNPQDYDLLLTEFGLKDKKKQFVSTLSGGERQKLSIVLAMIGSPELVFLDELTTGLDTAARRDVWRELVKLRNQGVTILLTSHYMDEVEALCGRIMLIKDGKEVISGTVGDVIKASPYDRLEEAYLYHMGEPVDSLEFGKEVIV